MINNRQNPSSAAPWPFCLHHLQAGSAKTVGGLSPLSFHYLATRSDRQDIFWCRRHTTAAFLSQFLNSTFHILFSERSHNCTNSGSWLSNKVQLFERCTSSAFIISINQSINRCWLHVIYSD